MASILGSLYIFLAFTANLAFSEESEPQPDVYARATAEIEEYQKMMNMAKTNVKFVLTASGFPSMDSDNGAPDPFVKITYYGGYNSAKYEHEETSILVDTYNPEWPDIFEIHYAEGRSQNFKLEFLDDDIHSPAEHMGKVEISLADMVNAPKGKLELQIVSPFKMNPTLTVYVLINNSPNADTSYRFTEPKRHMPIRFKRFITVYE